jgi:hypothetical protein
MSLPTPNLYYSFNIPDKNLYNNVQNWATGYPVYDASLNNSYISRQNFTIGNGSLEMPKNRITTPPIAKTALTKTQDTLSVAVSNDQLRMVTCEYPGSVSFRTTTTPGVFSNDSSTVSNSATKYYYRVVISGDGNRLVTCDNNGGNGGYIYFSTWNSTAFPALTQTLETNLRVYHGVTITNDGSRLVASTNTAIFFSNWDGINYGQLIQTLETIPPTNGVWMGIGISSNGDRVCYGDNLTSFRLSYWNGSNYNKGVIIRTYSGSTNMTRSSVFNNDSSLLFLSFINNAATSIEIAKYNPTTNGYDFFYNIPTGIVPALLDSHGLCCVDTNTTVTIYLAPYSNSNIYVTEAAYITTNGSSYANVNANAIQIGSTPGTSGLSFAFWFRSNYNGTWARICDFGNGVAQDNILIAINGNNLRFGIYKGAQSTEPDFITYNINDNKWYHAVITLACSSTTLASNVCTAYINGSTNTFTNTAYLYPNVINRTNNYLGRSNWDVDPQFFGNIDDFRVYPTVLTAAQVNEIYNIRGLTNNYRNSTVYRLYNVPVETVGYDSKILNMGSNTTYFYWNDPKAGLNNATPNGTTIINKSNPYNFKYTYNNTVPYLQVNVTFVCNDIITLKVNGSTIRNNGTLLTIYTETVSINSGNNLFEFLCYNTLGPAVFAAYVVSTNNSTYLFSTNFTTNGWSVEVSGFFSNGYPVSSLLTNESGAAKTNIGTTFFRSQNLDLDTNQANKQVPASNLFFRTNNVDFKDQFFKYV